MTTKTRRRAPEWLRRVRALARAPRPTTEVGMCLRETREVLGVGAAALDAIGAWKAARFKHPTVLDHSRIPAGVPIFWAGGSAGHGHVAIAAKKRGYCWSVDKKRPGHWDRVPIDSITHDWRLQFLGWTEDLNGVRVYPRTERR